VLNNLIELLGFALIATFAWFVWPPLVLLVVGLLLVLWANVRPARARRAQTPAPDQRVTS
jgi:hypothetical protein